MTKYTLIETDLGSYVTRDNDDGSVTSIPLVEANSDYQAYLATLVTESAPTA